MGLCEYCLIEHDEKYGSGRFCSNKCARGFSTKNKRKEINNKVSKSLKGRGNDDVTISCKNCNIDFNVTWNKRHQEFCSKSCSTKWKNLTIGMAGLGGRASAAKLTKRSKNEILFFELCDKTFNNVEHNVPMFNGWDADIILNEQKIAILWNGIWHYKKITESHSLSQVKNRDKIKLREIKNCGFTPYVIKDMGSYDPEFVNKEFNIFLKHIAR